METSINKWVKKGVVEDAMSVKWPKRVGIFVCVCLQGVYNVQSISIVYFTVLHAYLLKKHIESCLYSKDFHIANTLKFCVQLNW